MEAISSHVASLELARDFSERCVYAKRSVSFTHFRMQFFFFFAFFYERRRWKPALSFCPKRGCDSSSSAHADDLTWQRLGVEAAALLKWEPLRRHSQPPLQMVARERELVWMRAPREAAGNGQSNNPTTVDAHSCFCLGSELRFEKEKKEKNRWKSRHH